MFEATFGYYLHDIRILRYAWPKGAIGCMRSLVIVI